MILPIDDNFGVTSIDTPTVPIAETDSNINAIGSISGSTQINNKKPINNTVKKKIATVVVCLIVLVEIVLKW